MRWYIYDENVITLTVFRLRIVKSICIISSDEKGTEEKQTVVTDQVHERVED